MGMKATILILVSIFVVILILVISLNLFSIWTFFGLFFLLMMYIFAYFFIVKYHMFLLEREQADELNKKKFDYCWSRINVILRRMPGGQGIEWAEGFGRRSELKSYHDGIQNRPFMSIMGYLAKTQQLVVVIYDIDSDNISRFYADPSPEVINNPFFKFEPFQSGSLTPRDQFGRYPYSRYPRKSRYNRGVSIHVGNEGAEDFDSFPSSFKQQSQNNADEIAVDAIERLKKKDGKQR